jgi:hypothetical protein
MDLAKKGDYTGAKVAFDELVKELTSSSTRTKDTGDRWYVLDVARANSLSCSFLASPTRNARDEFFKLLPHLNRLASSSGEKVRRVGVSVAVNALAWNFLRGSRDAVVAAKCVEALELAVCGDPASSFDLEDVGAKFTRVLNDGSGPDVPEGEG